MIHVIVLENWQMWPFHHRPTFSFNGRCSKIGCMDEAYSKPKPQKSAGGQYVLLCLLVIDWLMNNINHSYPVSLPTVDEKWCLYANMRKRKEWSNPKKRRIFQKCSNFFTLHSIFWHPWLHSLSSNNKTSICEFKHNNNWISNKKMTINK